VPLRCRNQVKQAFSVLHVLTIFFLLITQCICVTSAKIDSKKLSDLLGLLDNDQDGTLSTAELRSFLRKEIGGEEFDTNEEVEDGIKRLLHIFDDEKDGDIELKEMKDNWRQLSSLSTPEEVEEWIEHSVQMPKDVARKFLENRVVGQNFLDFVDNDGELLRVQLEITNKVHRENIKRLMKAQLFGLGSIPAKPEVKITYSENCDFVTFSWEKTKEGFPVHKYRIEEIKNDVESTDDRVYHSTFKLFHKFIMSWEQSYEYYIEAWNGIGKSDSVRLKVDNKDCFIRSIDRDGDGTCNNHELSEFLYNYIGGDEFDTIDERQREVEKLIRKFDRNNDGDISVKEVKSQMNKPFLSTTEDVRDWIEHSLQLPDSVAKKFEEKEIKGEDFVSYISNQGKGLMSSFSFVSYRHRKKLLSSMRMQILGIGSKPTKPEVIEVEETCESISMSFPEARTSEYPVHKYTIQRKSGGSTEYFETKDLEFKDDSLSSDMDYDYHIYAWNTIGKSDRVRIKKKKCTPFIPDKYFFPLVSVIIIIILTIVYYVLKEKYPNLSKSAMISIFLIVLHWALIQLPGPDDASLKRFKYLLVLIDRISFVGFFNYLSSITKKAQNILEQDSQKFIPCVPVLLYVIWVVVYDKVEVLYFFLPEDFRDSI